MKDLVQMCLVMMAQSVACYLAAWPMVESVFILVVVLLWQGLFIFLFHRISKKQDNPGGYKYNKVFWYAIMPACSLISPLISLFVFIAGTLCDLRKVSGCVSIKQWLDSQIVEGKYQNNSCRPVDSVYCPDRNESSVPLSVKTDDFFACSSYPKDYNNHTCNTESFNYVNNDHHFYDDHHVYTNPTTGLPMVDGIGSVDTGGNVYGCDRHE